jgi:hypothetical protein
MFVIVELAIVTNANLTHLLILTYAVIIDAPRTPLPP